MLGRILYSPRHNLRKYELVGTEGGHPPILIVWKDKNGCLDSWYSSKLVDGVIKRSRGGQAGFTKD